MARQEEPQQVQIVLPTVGSVLKFGFKLALIFFGVMFGAFVLFLILMVPVAWMADASRDAPNKPIVHERVVPNQVLPDGRRVRSQ